MYDGQSPPIEVAILIIEISAINTMIILHINMKMPVPPFSPTTADTTITRL
jgi:hypothetical protein